MTKKATTENATPDAGAETQKRLYTAHQVHTLVQLIFHRMRGEGQPHPTSWMQPMGGNIPAPFGAAPYGISYPPSNGVAGRGCMQTAAAPPVLYWYS